jgi:beta-xylosidase
MDFSPCYNLDTCNRYAKGQWATSFRFNKGKYYLLFITLNEGGFICVASKPEGPWEIRKLPKGFYDPGLFFDEDGRIYVAHGYSNILVTELNPDFSPKGKDSLIFKGDIRPGLEGSHVYRINGTYYILGTYGGRDGFQVCLRSNHIYGPYEEKIILRDDADLPGYGLHQASLVQIQNGEYWSIIFQDRMSVGRIPHLEPVEWKDGWPMLGVNGKGVITYKKPDVGRNWPVTKLPASDEFSEKALGMQWGWNHNPDSTNWTLTKRSGYLTLSTAKIAANLKEARNTLTQRIIGPVSTATAKIDVTGMKDGDVAGLAVFQDPYAFIGIKSGNGLKYIVVQNNGTTSDSVLLRTNVVYLRIHAVCSENSAAFSYSPDNLSFINMGSEFVMQYKLTIFVGNRFCLFNYATKALGGSVDIDWFRVE